MSEARLDQIVKGAPQFDTQVADTTSGVADPLAHLPSSPPQIYLNLLILEASLRAQFLELRARRRQHTFFLTLLALWTSYFAYALFLAPREDGSGVGGSVYWVVEVTEKVCLMGGVVTAMLVWGTGQWERGIRWPRRWVGITNRGLRGFNCKIVVVKGPWWKEWLSTVSFFFSSGLIFNNGSSTYRYIPPTLANSVRPPSRNSASGLPNILEHVPTDRPQEEDLSVGGDTIALLLLPKPFSPTFRENWDLYRTEYWERENERRRLLLKKVREYDRAHRRKTSWWKRLFWPTPPAHAKDVEKHGHHHSHSVHKSGHLGVPGDKERKLRSGSVGSRTHSRTSSRSSTPAPSGKDEELGSVIGGHSRRSSTASSASRKKRTSSNLTPSVSLREKGLRELRPAFGASDREGSRSTTPETVRREVDNRRSLISADTDKRNSFMSDTSMESMGEDLKERDAAPTPTSD